MTDPKDLEAADNYATLNYSKVLQDYGLHFCAFLSGSAHGRRMKRERILGMLRSEDAQGDPGYSNQWADWLESRLGKE